MITVKSSTKQPIDIYVSQKGVPYSGDFFISITKEGEEIYNKKATAKSGWAEVTFPNLFQGNYKFSIETDEGFSREKDLRAVKSNMGGNNGKKTIDIDIDAFWDDNKDEMTPKVKEFYDQHRDTIDSLKDSNRMLNENFSTSNQKVLSQIEERTQRVSDEKSKEITERGRDLGSQISTLYQMFSNNLDSQYNDIIDSIGQKEQEIKELINTGLQNSRFEYQNNIALSLGLTEKSLNARIDALLEKIPNSEILAYGVDDSKTGKTVLRSSDKIVDYFQKNKPRTNTNTGGYFPTSDINDSATSAFTTYSSSYIESALDGKENANASLSKRAIQFTIDGGGSVIATGYKGFVVVPYGMTITGRTLLADQSGSIVIDVWKETYANYAPTVADTITGADKPTLSSVIKNQNNTLTEWTVAVAAGDIIAFNVDSVATVTKVVLVIEGTLT